MEIVPPAIQSNSEPADHDKSAIPNEAKFFQNTNRTERALLQKIEGLNVSADAKAILANLLRLSSQVGRRLVRIGRKILDLIFLTLDQFPTLAFATAVALVVGALLSAVPLIGTLLGAVLSPLAIALGIAYGAKKEMDSPDLQHRIRLFVAQFKAALA
ncbi:hypothetical protein [Delftia sp. UME58]|uniref:hypothetical protein n=1 Tax=Delftia sp. UME58 TaxID=1862322 RepID=UPI001603F8FE|nr:hypothetical protein [Delftia sp. UME58]MBB1648758.1 hypothetical protein [Delftia sp. UME58]